jgi:SWI/SNF-related matrix-associated actin-dependent regulator of chromatin subfamily A-like protein 1
VKTPFEHQHSGAAFATRRRKSMNGDVPGLGKTLTAILALAEKGCSRPLVICPAVARSHWANEFAEFGWPGAEPRIYSFEEITNGGVPLMAELIHRALIDSLVVDEWTKLKHVTSQRAQLIAGNNGYIRRVPHVIALSGSITRHAGEYYTILCALVPELLAVHGIATREQFMERFTTRVFLWANGERREKVVGQQNVDELKLLLDAVQIKRGLPDVGMDVPRVWWQQWRIDAVENLTSTETNHFEVLTRDGATLEEIAEDPYVARMRRRLGELKAPVVAEALADQLEGTDEQIVVFAHHRSVLIELQQRLAHLGVSYIDGDTSDTHRDHAVRDFQLGRTRVFLGQNIACQFSLTLTAAHRVILVEPDWTADTNYQLGQRIARIGSTADRCIGQLVVLAGTLDEAIVAQNARELKQYEALHAK